MPGEAKPSSITENTASPALDLSRRGFVATASAAAAGGFALGSAHAAIVRTDIANLPPYGNGTLPPGIRSRRIANVNGLTVHILEAGYEIPGRPAVLLLHGFPELPTAGARWPSSEAFETMACRQHARPAFRAGIF